MLRKPKKLLMYLFRFDDSTCSFEYDFRMFTRKIAMYEIIKHLKPYRLSVVVCLSYPFLCGRMSEIKDLFENVTTLEAFSSSQNSH